MAGVPARDRASSAGLLSIGQVLARLSPEFPGLSSSKLRFLEVQGIVTPTRTESGYRKFAPADVERLRLALTLQRDHYLPLHVIRGYLDDVDAGRDPVTPIPAPPTSIVAAPRRYRRDELLAAAGAAPQLLNDAISTGVIAAAESYTEQTVALLRCLVALDRHGIEPRHIRTLRQSAERDAALFLHRLDFGDRGAQHDDVAGFQHGLVEFAAQPPRTLRRLAAWYPLDTFSLA